MKKLILVVDDEKPVVEMIRDLLESCGYEVVTASDGEEALSLARARRPDLILMDVTMPKLDGCEVCRRLKSDKETENLEIILLTGRRDETGSHECLEKPFEMSELLRKVRDHLSQ